MLKIPIRAMTISILALASSYCPELLAWGMEGHKIIALIAESRLSAESRRQIDYILARHENGRISDIASWADQVRGNHQYPQISHAVRIPFDALDYSPERDCAGKYKCVIYGIEHSKEALNRNNRATRDQKATALKFLVHYVGDIHQPLHCIAQTGNIKTLNGSQHWKLHKIWDTIIIRKHHDTPEAVAESLLERRKLIEQGSPQSWAMESHNIAKYDIYSGHLTLGDEKKAVRLDRNYYSDKFPIIEDRLLAAGIRLGNTLNTIFEN